MEINTTIVLSVLFYKMSSLAVGSISIYLGYKLFIQGIWGHSGDLSANFRDNKLVLKKAAPGTFFAVLGAVIICSTIYKGFSAKNELYASPDKTEIHNSINDHSNKPALN